VLLLLLLAGLLLLLLLSLLVCSESLADNFTIGTSFH